jgi:hypothetical protein
VSLNPTPSGRPALLHHFALLAPVPLVHLESGLAVAETEGFVAFGIRKWELLRKLEGMRRDVDGQVTGQVAVLIYQSQEDAQAQNSWVVSWFGWYAGSVETDTGAHPGKMQYRPPTTVTSTTDNLGHWSAYVLARERTAQTATF